VKQLFRDSFNDIKHFFTIFLVLDVTVVSILIVSFVIMYFFIQYCFFCQKILFLILFDTTCPHDKNVQISGKKQ
jgi:hypothetical protein